MDFPTLCTVFKEWEARVDSIREFEKKESSYYHNGKRVIQLYRELLDFLRSHEPAWRQWMTDYLEKNRKEIFVKWWVTHVDKWVHENHNYNSIQLHPKTQEEWDNIFGDDPATCFELAKRVVMDARTRYDFSHCDDLTIKALHEGKEHSGGWWGCDICDTQEELWKTEMSRRVRQSAHPLLNPDKSKCLHYYWRHKEKLNTLGNWTPPHVWGTINTTRFDSHTCYDFEEYSTYLRLERTKNYSQTGQTPCQAIETLLNISRYNSVATINYYENYETEFNAFVLLWNKLDLFQLSFDLDLARLRQIEDMY